MPPRRTSRTPGDSPVRATDLASPDHWRRFQRLWDAILPPLRPATDTVEAFREHASAEGKRLLLLGVTPELAEMGDSTVAVDSSRHMIAQLWRGRSTDRRVILGDWRSMPLHDRSVDVACGDGSLNVLAFPGDVERTLDEVRRALAPGGRAVFRVYCTPEPPETLDELARAAHAGRVENVFSLKWRVAMARVGEDPGSSIHVPRILDAFNETFPDRRVLAENTGFAADLIDTVDLWEGSEKVFSFPTLSEILDLARSLFERVSVVGSGRYALAERCPIVVCHGRDGPSP